MVRSTLVLMALGAAVGVSVAVVAVCYGLGKAADITASF